MEAVVYVWRVASASAHPFLSRRFLAREARLVRTFYLKNTQTWVLETGGHVVGFVSLTENKVGGLFLDPRFHGRGFGKALMDKAVALRGAVSVEVFKKNVKGRRFYNRYGFVYEGEYYHTPSGQIMVQMFYEPEPEKAFSPYPASFSRAI